MLRARSPDDSQTIHGDQGDMKRFSNILLVPGSEAGAAAALKRATTLASENRAELTVCAVVDEATSGSQMVSTGFSAAELREIVVSEIRERLEKMVADAGASAETKILTGKSSIEIIRQVLRDNHDLVIKNAEGATRLKEILFGGTDMHLLRKCPCPVWITKSTERSPYRRILAAVDLEPDEEVKDSLNRQIIEMSTSLARAEGSELHVLHAWQFAGEDILRSKRSTLSKDEVDAMEAQEASERKRWLEGLVMEYGGQSAEPHLHVVKDLPKHAVPATAKELDADVVVMGTVARTGIAGFLMGNTAETILNQLDCSVLTVKPPEFVSPVTLGA